MVWRDIALAHWRADPERIAALLPPAVTLDLHAGEAWLSVVPFRLTAVRLRGLPVLPGFGDVGEINLRTYVRAGALRGIWFFSLDAGSPPAVRAARLTTSLPYYDARIETSEAHGTIAYASERRARGVPPGRFIARYAPPATERPCVPDSLDAFLHERYTFFAVRRGRLIAGRVRHRAWTVGELDIEIVTNTLGDAIGHPLAARPARATFSRELPVRANAVARVG